MISCWGEADHSIQALTVVELAYIPQRAILELAAAYPAIAQAVWRDNLVDASLYREWILNVGRRNARQRLSHLLCELVLRQEAAGICTGKDYSLPITQEQLADALGLTPIHVNRTIQALRRDKLIEISSHRLIIRNWQALQTEGDFRPEYLHLTGHYEARSVCSPNTEPLRKLEANVAV